MINTLVSLNADLASSIAFRYSCRLTEFVDMRLQTIHVEEVDAEGYPPGSGWVRSTWEKGLLQSARQGISRLINTEKTNCPPLGDTIVRIGDHDDQMLQEIAEKSYDLYIEGVLNAFDAQLFHQKVKTKFFKHVPLPILLVKNLVAPSRIALLMEDPQDAVAVISAFLKIFGKSKLALDLVHFTITKSDQGVLKEKIPLDATTPDTNNTLGVIAEAKALLGKNGWAPKDSWTLRGNTQQIGEMLGDYGLVGAFLPRNTTKKRFVMELLSRVPSATLICK